MGSRADKSSKPNLTLGPHLAGIVKVTNLDNKVFFFLSNENGGVFVCVNKARLFLILPSNGCEEKLTDGAYFILGLIECLV